MAFVLMTSFPVHMVLPWHKVNGLPAGNPHLLYKKVAILTSFHRIAQGASLNAAPYARLSLPTA